MVEIDGEEYRYLTRYAAPSDFKHRENAGGLEYLRPQEERCGNCRYWYFKCRREDSDYEGPEIPVGTSHTDEGYCRVNPPGVTEHGWPVYPHARSTSSCWRFKPAPFVAELFRLRQHYLDTGQLKEGEL